MIEWLETDGAGAFACSTETERNDRKYHGLLATPIDGAEGRFHILSSVDCTALDGSGLVLGTNQYPGAVYPEGYKNISAKGFLPSPWWIYSKNGTAVKKEIMMIADRAVWIIFTLLDGPSELALDMKFLFTYRNTHELTKQNNDINAEIVRGKDTVSMHPYSGLPGFELKFSGGWNSEGELYWDNNICYEMEKQRGHEWIEDRFVPGTIRAKLLKNIPFVVRAGIIEDKNRNADAVKSMVSVYENEKENVKMRRRI